MQKRTNSLWKQIRLPSYEPLKRSSSVDVVIVGAGISGLTIAYFLTKLKYKVMVIDAKGIGGGQTHYTTAHLTYALDEDYAELVSLHGLDKARLAAQSHRAAIDMIAQIVAEEGIACDFERVDGYRYLYPGDKKSHLTQELDTLRAMGFADVTYEPQTPLPWNAGPGLRFPQQARFHPLKYLRALAKLIVKRGGIIHTETMVSDINAYSVLTEDNIRVFAKHVVVATHTPINQRLRIHTKLAPYRSYVVCARIPKNSLKDALFWDTADPYHYIRLHKEGRKEFIIIGGADHKTGQGNETTSFALMERYAKEHFPFIKDIDFRWSGQVMEPVDGLGYIGRNAIDRTYIACGYAGIGMTHGTIAGMLISNLIAGKDNEWAALYDPARKSIGAFDTFMKENVNVASQYLDYVADRDEDFAALKPGEGAVLSDNRKPIAAYRNEDGELKTFSAICTHLGCIVKWNKEAGCFDCPCHGSQFNSEGRVVHGPTITPLRPVSLSEEHRDSILQEPERSEA